jgi:uncharacterized hydrophobic protein (TIGR00271 family)
MLHLRVTVPSDRSGDLEARLHSTPGVAHVAVLRGVSTRPPGDLILCDVAREAADGVVEWLQAEDVHRHGAITVGDAGTVVSDAAARAEAEAPGHGTDALVWEELEARAREEVRPTASLLVLMVVATMIAAVGLLLDSPVLIVGAMVVGPEYGPLAAVCVAAVRSRWRAAGAAMTTLLLALGGGAAAAFVLSALLRATSVAPDGYDLSDRQLTAFISEPDVLGVLVALLAGIAGMLALTEARSGTLVGVLVSVTTVPAAANIGLAAAYGEGPEVIGSAVQLALNLLGLLVAGTATLIVQARVTRARPHG